VAAKKFLLDYFDHHHLDIDWDFDVEFEVVPTGGSRPPPPIDAGCRAGFLAALRGFAD